MDEQEQQLWDDVLKLWETLSKTPDKLIATTASDFKNNILKSLGLPTRNFGCPFCDEYLNTSLCPIGACEPKMRKPCYLTPYGKWERTINKNGYHNQKLATEFYNYLKNLYKKRILI